MGGRKPVSPGSRAPSAACGPCGSPAGPGTGCTGDDRRPGTTRASRPSPPRLERAARRQRERNETEKGRAKESCRSKIPRPPTGEVPDPSGREGPCRGWFLQKSGRKSWVHLIISCNPVEARTEHRKFPASHRFPFTSSSYLLCRRIARGALMPDFLPLTPQILRFKKIFPRLQNKTIHIIGRSCMIYKGLSVRQFPGCPAPEARLLIFPIKRLRGTSSTPSPVFPPTHSHPKWRCTDEKTGVPVVPAFHSDLSAGVG